MSSSSSGGNITEDAAPGDAASPETGSGYDGGYPLVEYPAQGDAGFPITRLLRPATPCGVPGFPRATADGVVELLDLTNREGSEVSDPFFARSGNRAATSSSRGARLWDIATLEQIARFEDEYVVDGKTQYFLTVDPEGLSVRAFSDGHRVGRIAGSTDFQARLGLAEDESYVYVVRKDGSVDTYSTTGAPSYHRDAITGDYLYANVVGAPNELRIGSPFHFSESSPPTPWTEIISLPSGATTKRTFPTDGGVGKFRGWFAGGEYFIVDRSITSAEVYSKDGTFIGTFPGGNSTLNVGGAGFYYWRRNGSSGLDVYDVRNPTQAPQSFAGADEQQQIVHGYAIYVGDSGNEPGKVVIFDPAGLRAEPAPIPTLDEVHGIAADKDGHWLVGDVSGGVFAGSVPGHSGEVGVLGCGQPSWSAAAGDTSPRVAVSSQSAGEIYVLDIGNGTAGLAARIPMVSNDFAFAQDGTRLLVAADKIRGVPELYTFEVPGGGLRSGNPDVTASTIFRTSRAGATLGRVQGMGDRTFVISNLEGTSESFREQSSLTPGGTSFDSPDPPPVIPSPSGAAVVVNDSRDYSVNAKARVISSGVVSANLLGYVYGWLDEGRLLARRYTTPEGGGFKPDAQWVILDSSGNVLATPHIDLEYVAKDYLRREPILLDQNTLLVKGYAVDLTSGVKSDGTGLSSAFGISGSRRVSFEDGSVLMSGTR